MYYGMPGGYNNTDQDKDSPYLLKEDSYMYAELSVNSSVLNNQIALPTVLAYSRNSDAKLLHIIIISPDNFPVDERLRLYSQYLF